MESDYAVWHGKITKLLILAALIPPSTAEAERSFSLMKFICAKLLNRLTNENLSFIMRIRKYTREITIKESWNFGLRMKKRQQRKDVLAVDYADIFIFLSIYLQSDFCLILFIIYVFIAVYIIVLVSYCS